MTHYTFGEIRRYVILLRSSAQLEGCSSAVWGAFFTSPDTFTRHLYQDLSAGLGDGYIHHQQVRLRYSTAGPHPELEESVLHTVEEDATTSTRRLARKLNVDQKTIWCILENQQLHSYHSLRVQTMRPEDFVQRVKFCRWFLHRCVNKADIPLQILFTDETKFTREGVINFRNSHVWTD